MLDIFINMLVISIRQVFYHRVRTIALVFQVVLAFVAITVSLTLIQGREQGLLPPELFKVSMSQKQVVGSMPARVFSGRIVKSLSANTNSIQSIAAYDSMNLAEISFAGQKFNLLTTLQGTTALPSVLQLIRVEGDLSIENKSGNKTILLEKRVAIAIFGASREAIGKTILFRMPIPGSSPEPMDVRGVFTLNDTEVGTLVTQAIFGVRDTVRLSGFIARAKTSTTAQAMEQVSLSIQSLYADLIAQGLKLQITTNSDTSLFSRNSPSLLDPTLVVFSGFGAILLAATAIGVFATALASAVEREKERAIKIAIGAKRSQLFTENLFEVIFTTLIGAIIGLIASWLLVTVIRTNVGLYLFGRSLTLQPSVLIQSVAIVILLNIFTSLYPIIIGVKVRPAMLFKET